ncbi:MAG: competence/damage-inducible protein A [Planctomycetota bacterium]
MKVEIISIGDEMTTGQRLDTNSQWLSQRCCELGLNVAFHTTVGDDAADNVAVFANALQRVDLVIATGGLGPTADDLTRSCLAELAGVPLERDPQSVAHIQSLFQRAKRPMPESNLVQADFPQGSRVIPNSEGTAPGIDLVVEREGKRTRFFCLPGVPAEMVEMWNHSVVPEINSMIGDGRQLFMEVINCFGAGESQIESMLPDLINRQRTPRVGITASQATISLRIQARGRDLEDARQQMAPTVQTIEECLGDLIFSRGDQTLEQVLVGQLQSAGVSLAICDFGLHGAVASLLAQAAGGSGVLRGSLALPLVAEASGELAEQRWLEQAEEVRAQFSADYGVVIGPLQPVESRATYLVTLVGPDRCAQQEFTHAGHTSLRLNRSIKQVLNFLRLQLRGVATY